MKMKISITMQRELRRSNIRKHMHKKIHEADQIKKEKSEKKLRTFVLTYGLQKRV